MQNLTAKGLIPGKLSHLNREATSNTVIAIQLYFERSYNKDLRKMVKKRTKIKKRKKSSASNKKETLKLSIKDYRLVIN